MVPLGLMESTDGLVRQRKETNSILLDLSATNSVMTLVSILAEEWKEALPGRKDYKSWNKTTQALDALVAGLYTKTVQRKEPMAEGRGTSIEDLKQELAILEAFNETGRAKVLRAIIEDELRKQEHQS